MQMNLEGKVALVTGGARDVGREIALTLAAEGAAVAVNYNSSPAEAEAVAQQIRDGGGKATAFKADVSDYAQVQKMVAAVAEQFGRIDILVNNAGLVLRERFLNTKPEDWAKQIGVGLFGVIHMCHAVAPYFVKQNFGRIVNLAGDSARVGENGLAITAASRGGVLSLTKSLAKELGRANVTANVITLGLMNTAHTDKPWLEKNRDAILRNYAIRRIGESTDVAPLVTFLASEHGGWVTGQIISVNGGFSMV
jgi:NAD(P)-dependent dehydrogenase (short-subunit alcohol dehydrogenase family)